MEKRISDLLSELSPSEIEIEKSDIVSAERIKELTMNKIREKSGARRVSRLGRIGLVAAILAMISCIGVGAVRGFVNYDKASGESMLQSFFGGRESMSGDRVVEFEVVEIEGELYKKLVTNIPAWQRMPISEELIEKLAPHIGAVEESVSYGGYTLTVEGCLYDANIGGGLLYYSVENPNGVEGYALGANGEIVWPMDSPCFVVVGYPEESYRDAERSTDTKLYICSHFVWLEEWGDFDIRIGTGPDRTEKHSASLGIELYDTSTPVLEFADGAVKLSHIGIGVDKAALGLSLTKDIDRIILRFADGSEYIAGQDDVLTYISNLAYALQRSDSGETTCLFNSVIDIEKVVEVQIEDMIFTVE